MLRKIYKNFLSSKEVSNLLDLWKKTPGFDATTAGRAHSFYGCSAPMELTLRALELLDAGNPDAKYLDSFFLHYAEQQGCDDHTDSRSLTRVNVLLVKPARGGVFSVNKEDLPMDVGDAVVFEPCDDVHSVSLIEKGERVVWSMGLGRRPAGVVQARNRKPTLPTLG